MTIDTQIANVRFALSQNKEDREERPFFAHAVILNSYVYATDSYILVKHAVENYCTDSDLLEGFLFHFDDLLRISKAKKFEFIDGYLFTDGVKLDINKHDGQKYIGCCDGGRIVPFEAVIPSHFGASYPNVGIDFEALNRLGKTFMQPSNKKIVNKGLHLEFTENSDNTPTPKRGIKVTTIINRDLYTEFGMIMPNLITF